MENPAKLSPTERKTAHKIIWSNVHIEVEMQQKKKLEYPLTTTTTTTKEHLFLDSQKMLFVFNEKELDIVC